MVAGNAESIGCGKLGQFILTIFPAIDRSGQRRFQRASIAQAAAAAMLGKLAVVDGIGNAAV